MDKEKYNQIIDEVYKNYVLKKGSEISEYGVRPILLLKEDFINKCKTDPEFSEKWGLKIEERELSDVERVKMYVQKTNTDTSFFPVLRENLDVQNIATKLITITYNNETVEIYE